jgi:hypothetical protein
MLFEIARDQTRDSSGQALRVSPTAPPGESHLAPQTILDAADNRGFPVFWNRTDHWIFLRGATAVAITAANADVETTAVQSAWGGTPRL